MSNETVASAFVMCYALRMNKPQKGTSLAQARAKRAKMGADPKIEYAKLREEWK